MPSNASGNRHDASGDGHVHDGNGEEETLLGTAASTSRQATKKAKRAWDGFIDFIFSDNVLEVAVGLTIASQFQNVVQAFVSNILLPPVSLIPGIERNFDDKFVVLRPGTKGWESKDEYSTIQQARDDGAIVLGWGSVSSLFFSFCPCPVLLLFHFFGFKRYKRRTYSLRRGEY